MSGIENADLLQCFHVAVDAGKCCVKTVEEIVDVRFEYTAGIRCAVKIGVSHGSPSLEGDLWLGRAGVDSTGVSRL
jgi:hypothetical protein